MKQPLVVSYGMGVDSTAILIEFRRRGIRPDLILFANTGGEKVETYRYRETINAYLERHGFPTVTLVQYRPKNFKHWPPYGTLEENCLTNGTLPSLAFGFKSCSLKWKRDPQDAFMKEWVPALQWWRRGGRVRKVIGYDAGPKDMRRRNHAGSMEDPQYDYWYPLIEWKWDRERCEREIAAEGLPVPPKSSCFFCPAMKAAEVRALPVDLLRRLVILEARAKPRLEGFMTQAQLDERYAAQRAKWEARGRKGREPRRKREGEPGLVRGLWRSKRMTEFIRAEGLLPADEIDRLCAEVPPELVSRQMAFASGEEIPSWPEFFDSLSGPELPSFCSAPALGDSRAFPAPNLKDTDSEKES